MKLAGKVVEASAREMVTWPCLQRLAQHFQAAAMELGQLVEEQHAVVGQADLARGRRAAAADHAGVADGVVRRRGTAASPAAARPA